MKILLVNPPIDKIIGLELPASVKRHEGAFPPLGLMYLAAYVKQEVQCEVKIIDALAGKLTGEDIARTIQAYAPNIVGITAHTHNLLDVLAVTRSIKQAASRTHICLGGPHARIFPQESIRLDTIDSVVPGEGEGVFAELVKSIAANGDLRKVKGILFKHAGQIIQTEKADNFRDLDSLPFPDRSLIDNNVYYSVLGLKRTMATMASSRGCPHNCSFCSTPKESFRMRSAENVVDEMEACVRSGIEEVHFVDDTFNADPQRVDHICRELSRRKLSIKWSFRGRVDGLSLSLLKRAKEVGCYRIHLGVETATDEGLAALNKGITIAQIKQVFGWARQIRLTTVAYFLLGCPHETNRAEVMRTIDFAKEIDPDFAMFNILTLYPGTELYASCLATGLFARDAWREFALDPQFDFQPPYVNTWLSRQELVSLLECAYKSFYLRPVFVWKAFTSSFSDFVTLRRRLAAGLRLLQPMQHP